MQETWVQSLGQEDPPGKEMATHSRECLENPMDRGAMGLQRTGHDWATNTFALPTLSPSAAHPAPLTRHFRWSCPGLGGHHPHLHCCRASSGPSIPFGPGHICFSKLFPLAAWPTLLWPNFLVWHSKPFISWPGFLFSSFPPSPIKHPNKSCLPLLSEASCRRLGRSALRPALPLQEVSRASAGQKAVPLCWPSPHSSCSVLTAADCLFATNTRLSHQSHNSQGQSPHLFDFSNS